MSEDRNILFQKYLGGLLLGTEVQDFEEKLKSDSSLKSDFEMYKMMEGYVEERVKHGEALSVLRGIGKRKKEGGATSKIKLKRINRRNLMAASFLLVLGFSSYFLWIGQSGNQLFLTIMKEHSPLPDNIGSRGDAVLNKPLLEAIKLFDERRIDESLTAFEKYNGKSDTLYRYLGHIYFIKEQFDTSIIHWNNIDQNSVFYSESRLMLCYNSMCLGQKELALKYFHSIPVNYLEKAKLSKIENLITKSL